MASEPPGAYDWAMAKNVDRFLNRIEAIRRQVDAFEAKVPGDQKPDYATELVEFVRTHLDAMERDIKEDSDA